VVGSVLVLPSPLVGAGAYAVLADAFRADGHSARVVDLPGRVSSGQNLFDACERAVTEFAPEVVVAHSNAGLVAPAVADGIPVLFVDAALPPPAGECAMAPAHLLLHLEAMADAEGLLPPWTQWWSEEDVATLFPDATTRAVVEATVPRLPLAYFRTRVTAPDQWEARPQAYLAFGATYADELARARQLGWPSRMLPGAGHLHHLHDPSGVARDILDLAAALVGDAGAGGSV
jgi:hypothetical protein